MNIEKKKVENKTTIYLNLLRFIEFIMDSIKLTEISKLDFIPKCPN